MKKTIIALFLIVSLLVPSVSQAMTVAEITSYISILQNLLNQILATSGGTNNLAAVSSTVLVVGDTVKTTNEVGVRSEALVEIGAQPLGAQGKIVSGPMTSGGFTWWKLDFTTGTDGWVKENYLAKVVSSPVTPEPITNPIPVVTFTASPSSITVGQASTLSWSSTNATSCVAGGSWGDAKAISGTQGITPTVTSTYTLTCTGSGGSASKSVTVTVNLQGVPVAPTLTLSASPTSITAGQASTLSWSSTNATSCTATGGWSGTLATSGTQSVTPTANTTYTLACTGTGGTATQSATVSVSSVTNPAPTLSLSATPTVITSGNPSTLSWSSTNATSCTATGGWSGTLATSGTQSVTPTANTTYTLACSGTGGTVTQSVSIVVSAPVVSGPITLPILPLVFSVPMPVQTGKVWSVPAGDVTAFKQALSQAQLGDTIELQAGSTYTGNFTLPNKTTGSGWIIIRTSAYNNLPASGIRVSPNDAVNMAKLVSPNVGSTITFAPGSHHYRLIGLDITQNILSKDIQTAIVSISPQSGNTADLPNNITLDRMYIHSQPTTAVQRCVHADGSYVAIIDSYLSECHAKGFDSQAIAAWNTNGPIKIVNNRLEGAGENIIFGGADPLIQGAIPSDIEIRNNYIYTPPSWGANVGSANSLWTKKNLFELKSARRVLLEGNILDGSWADGQVGNAFVIKSANQSGKCTWCQTTDFTVRYNYIKNMGGAGGVSGTSGSSSTYPIGGLSSRILFEHNIFENINVAPYTGVARLIELYNNAHDVIYRNNTYNTTGLIQHFVSGGTSINATNFEYKDNIAPFGEYGLVPGFSEATFAAQIAGTYNYSGNVVYGNVTNYWSKSKYPNTTLVPDYVTALSIGKGANIPAVLAATQNAMIGGGTGVVPPPPPPSNTPTLTLSASPTSITAGQSSTLSWSSTNATSCTATGGWSGTLATSGTQSVTPTANTTYTLACTGTGGTATQSATVSVGTQTPPPTQKFSVGDSVQTNSNLNVRTSPSTGEKTIVGTQPIASAGKVVAGPTTAVGYTWWNVDYVNAPDGWSVENYLDKTSGVIVPPPSNTPTLTLSASPTSITAGQSSTLSWSSTNATSCTATGGWSGTLATSGTQTVTPTANTTYTLACTGTGGTATQSATVVVGSTTGGSVTLKFNSTQPKDVYAGYSMIGSIRVSNGTTNNDYVDVAVQNIPTGMTFTWLSGVNYSAKGLNLQVYHGDGEAAYRIAASSNVAPGDYSLNLIATERTTGISSTLNVPFTVTASPSPITKLPVGASPALPAMTKYNSDMLKYAQTYCNSTLSAGVESGVWYYDGERVYYNISDYTGDPTWGNTCAQNVESMYKNYVISNNGGVPGWRNFSKGLRMDYERTGDATSKTAALLLARSYPLYWNVDQTSSREIAYAIDSMINAEKLGSARNPELANMVDLALGHIDQWAVAKNASYLPPFMVALTAEALIGYYDLTGDPRVPVSLKAAADHIWNVAWDNTSQSFYYYDRLVTGQGGRTPAPDLNNLISPLYGWLYSITGDTKYLTQGDQIFTGGVNGAWLGQGKPFSQNYRWSMNYLKWTGRIPNINLPAFTMNSGQTVVLGASTTGIGIGDSVVTTSNLNVRDAANGSLLGKQPVGMFGTVKAGPVSVGGYTWWNIDYVNAPDGWSVENYLLKK